MVGGDKLQETAPVVQKKEEPKPAEAKKLDSMTSELKKDSKPIELPNVPEFKKVEAPVVAAVEDKKTENQTAII